MNQKMIDEIRKESCLYDPCAPECSIDINEKYTEQIVKDIDNPPVVEIIKN
jgi:hypothetical protein